MPKKILIVDDDVPFCTMVKTFLSKKGYLVDSVFSYREAEAFMKSNADVNLVITDVRLPDSNGIEILRMSREINPKVEVILMTGYSDIKTAVNVMRLGAFDYIEKPINTDEIIVKVNQALNKSEKNSVSKTVYSTTNKIKENNSDEDFVIGKDLKSKELNNLIDVVAPTNISVLILGDSGTGKENIAYTIHKNSKRANQPYIAVDCGAIPKELAASEFFGHIKGSFTGAISDKIGHFEEANGGTIFLDEVGNLSYDVQIQLLRAIQERKVKPIGSSKEVNVDIRIIAATNEDLKEAVKKGLFREDLYHRLNEFSIVSPKLMERGKDILLFADFFLKLANKELEKEIVDFTDEVKSIFSKYNWPGNLREMKNVIKRSVLLANNEYIEKEVLPSEFREDFSIENKVSIISSDRNFDITKDVNDLKLHSSKNEEQLIRTALEKAKYNKTKAALFLGVDRKTLYNKIKLYKIEL